MTYSNAYYQPSILELAQEGNCRALTYWINSLLGPQGISVQVQPAPANFLKIIVNFRRPQQRETCFHLRDRIVRFICYRLWTLNSDAIDGVRIVARVTGDSKVLWQQSVRINSPAALRLRQQKVRSSSSPRLTKATLLKFQIWRSVFLSSVTVVGFLIGYWMFYLEVGKLLGKTKMSEAASPAASDPTTPALAEGVSSHPAVRSSSQAASVENPVFSVPEEFQGQIVSQVQPAAGQKVIALTFDDGPRPETTPQVLDILKQYNVKATFFLLGANVQQFPELSRRIVDEGHAVGNHTWNHVVENASSADASHEIDDTTQLIADITGAKTSLFRPPDGRLDSKLVDYAKQRRYAVTLWSVESQDALVSAPLVLDNVLRNAQPGRIVSLHDGGGNRAATVQALPQLITALQQQGYRFVTVPELLALHQEQQSQNKPASPRIPRPTHTRSVAAAPRSIEVWGKAELTP
ncbi:MAG: polysaccharide deacetylase family protein [Synechococcales cyanobacterium C42_A2020_086]|nr:polysaccharide deacetylase family protein [Synechococcales cyanobacterium C42_A2020_086]